MSTGPNPHCGGTWPYPDESGENASSVGYLVSLGAFQFLNLGDITLNLQYALACPENKLGEVDIYQVPHHGNGVAPQLTWARAPVRWANSHAPGVHRCDRTARKLVAVATEDSRAYTPLAARVQVNQANGSAVWASIGDGQLAEVLVECHQYLSARPRRRHKAFVSGIRGPVTDPVDVVPLRAQHGHGTAPHAGVEQNPHLSADPTSGGSMRSCPTRRRAYTRHARISSGSSQG
jgi:hypothetical protein